MLVLCAAIPLLTIIVLMLGFNRPAKEALPIGWGLAFLTAVFVWHQKIAVTATWAVDGFLEAIGTFSVILGAVLVMNTMKNSGAMAVLEKIFRGISPDRRIQAILIGFCFEAFFEGAAGFGTPAAIAAPLMIGLGFPPLCAAMIALIFNSVPVSFGAIGVPTSTCVDICSQALRTAGIAPERFNQALSFWTAIPHAIACLLVIMTALFLMCRLYGKNHRGSEAFGALPFALFTTLVFDVLYIGIACLFGSEFPSLLGGMLTLGITIFAAQKGFLCPRESWTFDSCFTQEISSATSETGNSEQSQNITPFMAWLPYLLIAVILVITRMNLFGLKTLLTKTPGTSIVWNHLFGNPDISWKWNWCWSPGIIPFGLVCLIAFFLFKMKRPAIQKTLLVSCNQCKGAGLALFFGVSMVYLYRNTNMASSCDFSMLQVLAQALAHIFSSAFFCIAPFIGVLGAFMSGSNTVSNTLFTGLQYDTALLVHLSPVLIVALQNIGGAAGNMICVNNVTAVCATTNTMGQEGKLIKTNLIPCLIYCTIVILTIGIAILADVHPLGL